MKSPIKVILFALTALLLFAFAIQQLTGMFTFAELNGVTQEKPEPHWTFGNYCTGLAQRDTEAYLKEHFGFREPLTRFYNQTVWSLFRYSNVEEKKRIMIAKGNWLFEPWTVEEYYQSCAYRYGEDSTQVARMFAAEAFRLYQIQKILEPYGTKLFVALLPGKNLVCQEHMPKNTRYFEEKKITAFDFYEEQFNQLGVNHINLGKWFVELKGHTDYPLFPQTGTHWSNLAAIHATDTLVRYMEQLGGIRLQHFTIGEKYQRTVKPDADLESLMNLMFDLRKKPNYLAPCTLIDDSTAVHPRLITIGDSFYWNIVNHTPFAKLFSSYPYWYYFSTVYFDGTDYDIKTRDVLKEVLSADYIMLSYATTQLYGMSNGFSTKVLLELCYDEDEIEQRTAKVRATMEKDSAWMQKIAKKAQQNGESMEQAITGGLDYLINNNLEKYFPALCDSIPTRRSLKTRALTGDSLAFVEWETRKLVKEIKSDSAKLEATRKKSIERGIDLEKMIYYDARWVVNHKLENGKLKYENMVKKTL